MKEKKDRVDDALSATKAAVEEGILIGGGAAFIHAGAQVNLSELEGDQKIGYEIIMRAINAPVKQIARNAGFDTGVVVNGIVNSESTTIGFNAATGEYVDMFEAGIIDPFKVARVALTNATSVSSLLLTTEAAIIDIPEPLPPVPGSGGDMGGGMPGMGMPGMM